MELLTVIIVAACLTLASGVMMLSHVRTWRAFQRGGPYAPDFDYRRRQFRRRMQTSAMLGILAVSLPIGVALTEWLRSGLFAFCYCLAAVLLVCWILLLAIVDIWATKRHFGRLGDKFLFEKLKLDAELRRAEREGKQPPSSNKRPQRP
ncbi:MAG: hypothetical protein ABFC63_09905 [Thermoguttaceae bacterium]